MIRKFCVSILLMLIGIGIGSVAIYFYITHLQHITIPHSKESTDDALADYTLWLMIFTGILAAATIGLGVATAGLYLTGKKQVQITREALIGDQRAWLVTLLEIGPGGLDITNGRAELDVRLKVSNVGRTPAHGAHTTIAITHDVANTAEIVKKLADDNKTTSDHGLPVSPNDFYYRPWYASTAEGSTMTRLLSPILIGCVTYRILQDNALHQVAFAYHLGRKDGSPWGGTLRPIDCHLEPEEITISPWTGGFAT